MEIVAFIFLVIAALFVARSVKVVPQQHAWVVERLGKFNATLAPGIPGGHVHLLADVQQQVMVAAGGRFGRLQASAVPVPGRHRAAADQRRGHELSARPDPQMTGDRSAGQAQCHHQQIEGACDQFGQHRGTNGDPPQDGRGHDGSFRGVATARCRCTLTGTV